MGGSRAFVGALHNGSRTQFLTRLKEDLALVQFSELFNQTNSPQLKYASRNAAGIGRADFTVWDRSLEMNRDLELTSVWGGEDDFPKVVDEHNPDLTHIFLSAPRLPLNELRDELAKNIRRIVNRHARRKKYPIYWLAIYANLSFEAYQLPSDYVAKMVLEALARKPPSGNVEQIWVWNHMRLDRVYPS